MNVLELDDILDQLPRSERKVVNTIENVIENGAFEKDFTGLVKEKSAVSTGISPRTGKPWNHVEEMRNNLQALGKSVEVLQRSVQNSELASFHDLLTGEIRRAQATASAFKRLLSEAEP